MNRIKSSLVHAHTLVSRALAVIVFGLGLVGRLVGAVLDSADGAVELVADGVAVLGLLLVGLALGLLGVAGELVGGPVDIVLDGVDGGLNEAPKRRMLARETTEEKRGVPRTRPERWCCCWKTLWWICGVRFWFGEGFLVDVSEMC